MVSSEALWPGVFSEIGLVAGLLPQRASISSWDWVRSTTHPPHPPATSECCWHLDFGKQLWSLLPCLTH